ncbi:MAG: CehA/McbA family metallohydrolase [Thermoproteota archaeon]
MSSLSDEPSGNPFESPGFWMKGNLHAHTTNSDGVLSPESVVDYYSSYGYDFLALTDHGKLTRISSEKLLLIPGVELVSGRSFLGGDYHVVAINVEDEETLQKHAKDSVQTLLDYLKENGFAIIAHPYWSKLTAQDLFNITNYLGIEIYNTGCDVEVAKGFSTIHWDDLLTNRINVYGFAVDDAHWYSNLDAPGGWISVKVRERSMSELLESIRRGFFYASTGPAIVRFSYAAKKLEAEFSPVRRVDVVSENGTGFSISTDVYNIVRRGPGVPKIRIVKTERNEDGEEVYAEIHNRTIMFKLVKTGLSYIRLEGFDFKNYVRLEVTDVNGGKAWTNPVFL